VNQRIESGVVALMTGIAAVAGSYAVTGFTPEFVVAPVSDAVVAATPDAVVTWSIQTLGSLGQQLGLLLSLVLTVGAFAVVTGLGRLLADRSSVPASPVVAIACVGVALALTGAITSTLAAGAGAGLVVALAGLGRRGSESDAPSQGRRHVLQAVAGGLGIAGAGAVLGSRRGGGIPDSSGPLSADVRSLLADADDRSLDVAGMEPLVSENFYQVDINNVNPTVEADDWSVQVTGAVEEEREFDFSDLTDHEAEHRFVTLRCVGEGLNGKKMDTALWTGVSVMDLLDEANLNAPENCCVMLRAEDDFFEEFPLSALEDGFLAYEMNGEPLPRGHGHPVRALIPGHWGEINVKWLSEIEVLDEEMDGYWEQRGWHGTGPVETVAKLHTVNNRDGSEIQVGGHAYAGTRGIDSVEVSTDGGESWTDATLSEPLPGNVGADGSTGEQSESADDAWRQWEYTYEAEQPHEVVVRATDGEGDLQPEEESEAFPSGPTGWVSRRVEP
jgi:DMSO/TMAO reductase YedYZ molybdopterin-dependent catalytic subunit